MPITSTLSCVAELIQSAQVSLSLDCGTLAVWIMRAADFGGRLLYADDAVDLI